MKIPLTGGAYQARSVIASAQRCLNLYIEPQPPQDGEPMPAAHYPTPGLLPAALHCPSCRCARMRQASNGKIYAVAGKGLYRITPPAGSPTGTMCTWATSRPARPRPPAWPTTPSTWSSSTAARTAGACTSTTTRSRRSTIPTSSAPIASITSTPTSSSTGPARSRCIGAVRWRSHSTSSTSPPRAPPATCW